MKKNQLEQDVWNAVKDAITEAVTQRLGKTYDSPLNKMIDAVVASREEELRKLLEASIDGALTGDFRAAIQDAVTHKLARIITAKMEGEIEKRATELRASPEFRARATLAVEAAIKNVTT